jgi:alkaline phosphatase
MILRLLSIALLSVALLSCSSEQSSVPKNGIYIVVDGMGVASITGARLWKDGSRTGLSLESFPVIGLARTYSSSDFVTDSAAAGTALASGVKTQNGFVGITDPKHDSSDTSRDVQTLFDLAQAEGKSVGIVTTARVTHATPAAFYAHSDDRNKELEIVESIKDSGLTVLLGGGRGVFYPESWTDPETGERGKRKDGRFVINELRQEGWRFVDRESGLDNVSERVLKGGLIGLFGYSHMAYESLRGDDAFGEPSLAKMVKKAIKVLEQNPNGYFLLVESGRVDHAAHENKAGYYFDEMLALDDAVKIALEQDDTLVVLTADHETGGLALNGYGDVEQIKGEALIKDLNQYQRPVVSWGSGMGYYAQKSVSGDVYLAYNRAAYPPYSARTGFAAQTAVDVPVLAKGPGQELFSGFMNNTSIAQRIASIFEWQFSDGATLEQQMLH